MKPDTVLSDRAVLSCTLPPARAKRGPVAADLWDAFIARLQANHPNERKLVNFIGSIDGYREEFLQAARAVLATEGKK